MKVIALSLLMLLLSFAGFAQAPARSEGAAAQPPPAAQAETAKPVPPAPGVPAGQPTAVENSKIEVPLDTLIPVVLSTTISTQSNTVGQAIFCKSTYPITVENRIIIPEGSSIRGTVMEVVRPGRVEGRAKLGLRFDEVVLPNGTTRRLRASLAGFGKPGKDRFDPKEGQVKGDRSKDAAGKLARTTFWGVVIGGDVGWADGHTREGLGMGAGAGAAAGVVWIMATRAGDVVLPEGISLTLRLNQPVTFDRGELAPPEHQEVAPPSRYDAGPALPHRD
jgi:type IV secretion system protein VirB10